jgi:hypothetical protein
VNDEDAEKGLVYWDVFKAARLEALKPRQLDEGGFGLHGVEVLRMDVNSRARWMKVGGREGRTWLHGGLGKCMGTTDAGPALRGGSRRG